MDLTKIKDKMIIVCNNSYKLNILKWLSQNQLFYDVKFFTKQAFLAEYLFSYDKEALYYLVNKYHFKIEVAKMYLDNLIYVEDLEYRSSKLKFLKDLKTELNNQNLLIYNPDFKNYIKDYQILVVGYPYLEKYEEKIFQDLRANIIAPEAQYELENVYEFKTLEEEVAYVAKSIARLLEKNIPLNNIKIMGATKEYYIPLKKIFNIYNIPLKVPSDNTLYNNIIGQTFLKNLNLGVKESLKLIQNIDRTITSLIVNICNKYNFINDLAILKQFLVHDFKNTPIDNFNYQEYVELRPLFSFIKEDDYVFLVNFSAGVIPESFKDEEYITDNIKEEVLINKTVFKNKKYQEATIKKLQSIKNLFISYKKQDNKTIYYPSSLKNILNLNLLKYEDNILESYSKTYDNLKLAMLEKKHEKYNMTSEEYFIYKNNLEIPYNTYDNSFKGIDNLLFKEFINHKLTLSYSSLNNYNKCAFRYYIANILKLDPYSDSFEAFVGSVFHDTLEKCLLNKDNIDLEIQNYLKEHKRILTKKEEFFLKIIKEDIKFTIDVLNKQQEYMHLDKAYYEKDIVIDKSKDIPVSFIGFVDKILYKEMSDKTLVAIIDYKTGNVETKLNYLEDGLYLQLPIYLYLVQKSNLFKNPEFVGFYLQYILDKNIVSDHKSSYEEKRSDNLKLDGFTTTNIHNLVEFDNTYENSLLIKGLKVKNDGNFYSSSKVLDNGNIAMISQIVEKNIDLAIENILQGNFAINPKRIAYKKNIGCEYCHFKDLCFKKEHDYINISEKDNLDFLKEGE